MLPFLFISFELYTNAMLFWNIRKLHNYSYENNVWMCLSYNKLLLIYYIIVWDHSVQQTWVYVVDWHIKKTNIKIEDHIQRRCYITLMVWYICKLKGSLQYCAMLYYGHYNMIHSISSDVIILIDPWPWKGLRGHRRCTDLLVGLSVISLLILFVFCPGCYSAPNNHMV